MCKAGSCLSQRDEQPKIGRAITEGQELTKIVAPDGFSPRPQLRADRPPAAGFALVVDGHYKSVFETTEAAETAGRSLKSAYPMLQIEIYDAETRVRSLLA